MTVVTATVLNADAGRLDDVYPIVSITVWREVNRIPHALLELLDGDPAQRCFALSDTAFFAPGADIEIKLRLEGQPGGEDRTVFKGKVLRHAVQASVRGSLLRVELKDAAVKLTQGRQSRVFRDQTDADLIGKLITDAGLKKGPLAATPPRHAEIVQYQCADWDFLLARAEANGLLVAVTDGSIALRAVDLTPAPKQRFDFGISDLQELDIEIDAGQQLPGLAGSAWNLADLAATAPVQAKAFALKQGNLSGATLATALGFADGQLLHPVPLVDKELQAWADARLMRSRMSLIRGRVSAAGLPALQLLDIIEIDGVGKRFNGRTAVTGLCHRVDIGGWRTDVQFGLSPRAGVAPDDVQPPPAAGLLPGIAGLQLGVVDLFEQDPDEQYRVKVLLPGVGAAAGPVWARLAAADAGQERGCFFRPEPGDEVVVGFFNQDPRQPVVLGALHSAKNKPPADCATLSDKNLAKGIVTRAGTRILFNDADKPSVTVATPGGNQIVIDDDKQSIAITDQHGNSITMNQDGITLDSAKDLLLKAAGKVQVESASVDMK